MEKDLEFYGGLYTVIGFVFAGVSLVYEPPRSAWAYSRPGLATVFFLRWILWWAFAFYLAYRYFRKGFQKEPIE